MEAEDVFYNKQEYIETVSTELRNSILYSKVVIFTTKFLYLSVTCLKNIVFVGFHSFYNN